MARHTNIFFGLCLLTVCASAQPIPITQREESHIHNKEIPALLNMLRDKYEDLASEDYYPEDIPVLIENLTSGDRSSLFSDPSVLVESDLVPGADTLPIINKPVNQYLSGFVSLFKGKKELVEVELEEISPLKWNNYFYYNVLFRVTFPEDARGNSYYSVRRWSEVKLLRDTLDGRSRWFPLINSLTFYRPDEFSINDTIHVFTEFAEALSDSAILALEKEERDYSRKKKDEEKKQFTNYLMAAQNALEDGDLKEARSQIGHAMIIDNKNKEVIGIRKKIDEAMAEKKRTADAAKIRQERIDELKIEALLAYNSYDFQLSASLFDSLRFGYGLRNDASVSEKVFVLSDINSKLEGIMYSMKKYDFDGAQSQCDDLIKTCELQPNQESYRLLQAELHFLKAWGYYQVDSTKTKRIHKQLKEALDVSSSRHVRATMLEAKTYLVEGKISDAVRNATKLIGEYADVPKYYAFRADINEYANQLQDALNDYTFAVDQLKTRDTVIIVNKARMEIVLGKYPDAVQTINRAEPLMSCYADAYYYRALAQEKLADFQSAGEDYFHAERCGLDPSKRATFTLVSKTYYNKGKDAFNTIDYAKAINFLTQSVLLDSNDNALFYLGLSYRLSGKPDAAISNLTSLQRRNDKYSWSYYQRGRSYSDKGDYGQAIINYQNELNRFPDATQALFEKARAELSLKLFDVAGADGAEAAKRFLANAKSAEDRMVQLSKSDTAFSLGVIGFYKAGKWEEATKTGTLAEKKLDSKIQQLYYYRGRSWYDLKEPSKADKDFCKVLELNDRMPDASYWHGLVLFQDKRYSKAVFPLNNAAASSGFEFEADANYYAGICKLMLPDASGWATAADNLNKAMQLDSLRFSKPSTLAWIGYSFLRQNNSNRVKEYMLFASLADMNDPVYLFLNACLKASELDYEKAIISLEKAMKKGQLDPKFVYSQVYFNGLKSDKAYKSRFQAAFKQP